MLDKMSGCYEIPPENELSSFLLALKELHNKGSFLVSIQDVTSRERIPWLPETHVVDFKIDLPPNRNLNSFWEKSARRSFYGSGTSDDFDAASCHAASECFERFFSTHQGAVPLRPSANAVYSDLNKSWAILQSNPLAQDTEEFPNPHFSKSGESFHVMKSEALRAAFCEVLERAALCHFLSGSYTVIKVTSLAYKHFNIAQKAAAALKTVQTELDFFSIENPWGVWVVFAVARHAETGQIRAMAKGSCCDFKFAHALDQALSELGRNLFMGPAAACDTEHNLQTALQDQTVPEFVKDNLRLLLPKFATRFRFLEKSAELEENEFYRRENFYSPQNTLSLFRGTGQEIWTIPLSENSWNVPGFAYKIICPGFPQNPIYSFSKTT